ncbi:MAG: nitroreductase family protein [Cyclobacteriaceae bacterium]|jgi:iodotyrosine deiodinase|nr:nitroreductase family protein [Cyclobacteriaceae bacterium]
MEKVNINGYPFVPLKFSTISENEAEIRLQNFTNHLVERRSVREFSSKPVSIHLIKKIIECANTAPSGANKQPWTFCLISNPEIKKKVRIAAEAEEKESYESRMSDEWLEDLKPLQTDWQKPFLEIAPYLIVVFKQSYGLDKNNHKIQHYYVNESVGLACGFLLASIHQAGLVALTHTPSPMNFLSKILNRPENEKPFLLIPVGYPAEKCLVPDLKKKKFEDVLVEYI